MKRIDSLWRVLVVLLLIAAIAPAVMLSGAAGADAPGPQDPPDTYMDPIPEYVNAAFVNAALDSAVTVTYTSSGNFVVPAGVTSIMVEAWGGGGGGGGRANSGSGGAGGGGGGAYARDTVTVVPGNTYSVTVGAGGPGGPAGDNPGSPGGDSYFDAGANVLAKGASGGGGGPIGAFGARGTAAASVGAFRYNGGNGAAGTATDSGGGGGGAGSTGAGQAASGTTGGAGRAEWGGDGANGLTSNGAGYDGYTYGGGGSGARRTSGVACAGGNGADGYVRITYTYNTPWITGTSICAKARTVAAVEVQIIRKHDGYRWDDGCNMWVNNPDLWNQADLVGAMWGENQFDWAYTASGGTHPAAGNFQSSWEYTVKARAIDDDGVKDPVPAQYTFIYDNRASPPCSPARSTISWTRSRAPPATTTAILTR